MKRVAFTIIYEGLHHLEHNNMAHFMADNFDLWVVVEGFSRSGGSTYWCNNLLIAPNSTDGTIEFMKQFSAEHKNVLFYSQKGGFDSKDEQVNTAIEIISKRVNECYLWQVDADEQWSLESIKKGESELPLNSKFAGAFQFNHYLCKDVDGRQLIARGQWGSGYHTRLWHWKGERFLSHEPPVLHHQKKVLLLSPKYEHYSYAFKKDVEFKGKYYKGYSHVPSRYNRLARSRHQYPVPLSILMGTIRGTQNSYIDAI